jgi:hypothetical protein
MSTQNLLNLKIHKVAEEPTTYEDPTAIYLVPDNGHTHGNITNEGTLSTANYVVVTDDNKKITTSPNITTTELGYLNGVSSSIQTQLNGKVAKNTDITGATKCKITYDSKGLVTAGANLSASDIPSLAASKITSGTFAVERIPSLASNKITAMTGYSKASNASAIATTDSLNTAIGKLEKALDGKSASGHTHAYLPLAGGTLTGVVHTQSEKYVESSGSASFTFTNCGLDMANSDIVGCNSIYFQDACESATEGIHFYGNNTTVHTLWCSSAGTLAFAPSRAAGNTGTVKFSVTKDGLVTADTFAATSDKRLKENITPYSNEKSILDLPIYKYNFIDDKTKKEHIGCLAQDLQEICPGIVVEGKDGYLAIEESKIVYLLLEEVKKLKKELDVLKKNKC